MLQNINGGIKGVQNGNRMSRDMSFLVFVAYGQKSSFKAQADVICGARGLNFININTLCKGSSGESVHMHRVA